MADDKYKIQKIDDYRWRIPREGKMRVDGIVYANEHMMEELRNDESLQQVINVSYLPGIVNHSLAMPDIHWGYGFPIGGVAAFDVDEGVVSPGGVGYDINCGVRLLRTGLQRIELAGRLESVVNTLFANIPSGVGSHRKDLKLSHQDEKSVLKNGRCGQCRVALAEKKTLTTLKSEDAFRAPTPNWFPSVPSTGDARN